MKTDKVIVFGLCRLSLFSSLLLAAVCGFAVPPEAPRVAINTWNQRVQVSWNRPEGATSYNLYYAKYPALDNWQGASMGSKIRAGLDLPMGASYGVVLTAVNADGEESELSGLATFEITNVVSNADTRNPVILFGTSKTDSDLFRDVGVSITLESTEKAIYAYDINAQDLTELKKINSPSYASSTIRAVSMDDRLFITRYWNGSEYYEFEEVDGDGSADYFTADALKKCFAVVGDSLFFSERRGEDLFGNPVGEGGFRELSLPDLNPGTHDVKGSLVFAEGVDDEICGYNMTSSKGVIYDAVWWQDGLISLVRRDPDSLERQEYTFDFRETDAGDAFSLRYLFGFYDGNGYFVRSTDNGIMQIWEYTLGADTANVIYIVDDPRFTSAPLYFDAAGDYLILGNNDGIALLIDRRKGTRTYFDVGSYYDLELYVK